MHKLKVTIAARLYDQHGKLTRKYRPRAAHSFLAQFIEFLKLQLSQATTSITDSTNTEQSPAAHAMNFRVAAAASDLTYGMLIGSANTPVDIDDYALDTPITADLTVTSHTFVLSYPTPSSRRLAISRTFSNALASPRAIEEVALYALDGSSRPYCIDRTLYSVAIPASSSLELTYRINVSV